MTTSSIEYQREWRDKSKVGIAAARLRYRSKPEKRELERAGALAYYYGNKTRFIERQRVWRAANSEKYREYSKRNYYSRRHDPGFRVAASIRASLNKALRGERKSAPTFKMLGYSLQELMAHLEPLFLPGMTWANYGKWHVDHHRPISSFVLPDQIIECFAISNLQPLWARDNISKHARWEG